MTRWMRAAAAAVGVVAMPVPMAVGQGTAPSPPSEAVPVVWMMQSGSYGGGTTSSIALGTSDWYEALLYVGDTREGNLCGGGGTGPRIGPAVLPEGTQPLVSWRVAVRRLAFDGATATIEVRWSRDVDGPAIQPADDFAATFTWRPMEDDERVLDLVRQATPAQAGCETQTLTLRYRPDGPEELSDVAIGYDIWLVQELPSGERRTRHLQAAARQADVVRFGFPAVGVEAPGLETGLVRRFWMCRSRDRFGDGCGATAAWTWRSTRGAWSGRATGASAPATRGGRGSPSPPAKPSNSNRRPSMATPTGRTPTRCGTRARRSASAPGASGDPGAAVELFRLPA